MLVWIGNIILLPVYKIFLGMTRLKEDQQNFILLLVMFCQLFFLYIFKDNFIFDDLWAYLIGFDYSKSIDWGDVYKIRGAYGYLNYELGWRYYVKLLSTLSNNEGILIYITGFVIIYSYFLVIKKHSRIPWLSIFLFIAMVFYNSLFVLRQNLAIALCMFSFPFIVERKFWKFLLVMGIAFLFHKTAFIFSILYFLYPIKVRTKTITLLLLGGLLLRSSITVLIDIGISYFTRYEIYRFGDYTANTTPFLISFAVLLFIGFHYYPFQNVEKYEKLFFIMVIVITVFDFSRIGLESSMIGRLSAYFFPAIIILLPNVISNIKTWPLKFVSITLISVLFFNMMLNQMTDGFALIF